MRLRALSVPLARSCCVPAPMRTAGSSTCAVRSIKRCARRYAPGLRLNLLDRPPGHVRPRPCACVTTSDLNRQGALYKRYIEKRRAVAKEQAQAAERKRQGATQPNANGVLVSRAFALRCGLSWLVLRSFSACGAPRAGS